MSDHAASLAIARRVHQICEQFERDWRAGIRPRIEDALLGRDAAETDWLLAELVVLEVELRQAGGESPTAAEYRARFPDRSEIMERALAEMETHGDPGQTTLFYPTMLPGQARGDATSGAGTILGDYELLGEIARGGMGVVYRARQRSLNRLVALKMMLSGALATDAERRRFRLEAELAAGLDHPNIVPIHDIGEIGGRAYFSMKLVDGGNLSREIGRLRDDPRGSARIVSAVARALHHAHSRGFLHCDLKPSNILLDAAGQPHLTDFGLARRVRGAGASSLTITGAIVGTPSYMAPEQAAGERKALTPAADVHGLGAILYELLTGRPPFRGPTVMETVVEVLEREPAPPSELAPGVPSELEAICLRCLEKSPADRYPSAEALADDLDAYLRGEVLAATTPLQRLRRWSRREPELAAHLGGIVLTSLLTFYNHVIWGTHRGLYVAVQSVLLTWAALCVVFQGAIRRGMTVSPVTYLWAATDVAVIGLVIRILDAFDSDLAIGFAVLIAASGLWWRASLVWMTTGLSIATVAALQVDWLWRHPGEPLDQYPNIVLGALAVTGFVVARQVNRIRALSLYYDRR